MKLWYKKIGYKENPFTIKPAFFDDEVIGYDKEIDTLVKKLYKGNICFLEAEFGKGKSSIITYLINEFKGINKLVHLSRNRSDRALNYTKLLKKANGCIKKIFGLKTKNTILIIDEVSKINKKDCDQIEALFKSKHIKSVLFADISLAKANLSPFLKKKIGKNLVKLKNITPKDAVELTKGRLDTKDLISDALIKEIFVKSKQNTRAFLGNLEKVFKTAFDKDKEKVSSDDLKCL